MTRRGALVVAALLAVTLSTVGALTPAPGGAVVAGGVDVAPPGPTVVVQPGDSLWTIARSIQPDGDVRPLVQQLAALNGGALLQVGQVLALPSVRRADDAGLGRAGAGPP